MTENMEKSDLYEEIPVEEEDTGSELMREPFNPSEINIMREFPTISNLVDMLKESPSEIDLNTDFQRSGDLWSPVQQSRLIESILVKFPLPAFYFDAEDTNRWLVVDGLQRLSCLQNFIVEEKLRLTGLEFLGDLENKKYTDLERPLRRIIDQTQVTAYIINPGTPKKVKYNIFRRINTGGLVLEPQEIRHALYQGVPSNFIYELANLSEFKAATEEKINPKRMLDREFVNRFVAFFITPPEDYLPDLESFLNESMEKIEKKTADELSYIKESFRKSMDASEKIFGNWNFRKADLYPERRKPINKAVFEIWAVALAKLSDDARDVLVQKRVEVLDGFVNLCKTDHGFISSVTQTTGGKTRVINRFSKVEKLIHGILNV